MVNAATGVVWQGGGEAKDEPVGGVVTAAVVLVLARLLVLVSARGTGLAGR